MLKGWLAAAVVAGILASAFLWACGADERDADQDGATTRDLGLIEKDTLTVASEIPFPPFEEGDPPDYEGFDIDVINAVADDLELETQIEDVPLSSILQGEGGFDVAISAVEITPDRAQRVNFSHPYFVGSLSLLVREEEEPEIQAKDDLADAATLGVEDGTSAEKYASMLAAPEVRAFASTAEASVALLNSEVDAVVASPQAAEEAVDAREGLSIADTFATGETYGIVVPQGKEDLLRAVNSALKDLKDEGALTSLYEEYFGVEAPAQVATPVDKP